MFWEEYERCATGKYSFVDDARNSNDCFLLQPLQHHMPGIERLSCILRPSCRDVLYHTVDRATLSPKQWRETSVGLRDDPMLRVEVEQRG